MSGLVAGRAHSPGSRCGIAAWGALVLLLLAGALAPLAAQGDDLGDFGDLGDLEDPADPGAVGLPGPADPADPAVPGGPLPPLAPGNPFADVPADHWAYGAIERLRKAGLLQDVAPDGGALRGRQVLTRYELAVLIARLVAKVQEAEEAGKELSEEERIVRDLTREFRLELQILGVRVNAFEERLRIQEDRVRKLDERRSNVRMEGFYRGTVHYVEEPTPLDNYRFDFNERPFPLLTEPGLTPLEQEVFLRLIGRATPGNKLAQGIEAFVELKGVISGIQESALVYGTAGEAPLVGDSGADSFATGIKDDKRVAFHRGHFVMDGKYLDLRAFSNEAATEPGDPSRLLSLDPGRSPGTPASTRIPSIRNGPLGPYDTLIPWTRDPARWPGIPPRVVEDRPFAAFSGVEAGGELGKISYFASALSDLEEVFFPGEDRYDVQDQFTPARTSQVDSYNLRLAWEPYKYTPGSGRETLVGFTYNETAWSYDVEDDANRVLAVDWQWARKRPRNELEYTAQVLASSGRGHVNDGAYRLDARYRQGGFLGVFKGYYYGHDFQALTAQDPFIDTDIHQNFLRTPPLQPGPDTRGERLARTQLRYTFDPASLETLDDLTLEMMYEVKAFDRDPLNPRANDHEPGSRFLVQAIADIDSRIHVEASSEIQKDIPQENAVGGLLQEEGALINDLRIDYRPLRKVGISGELGFIDDFDNRDPDGRHFAFQRKKAELQLQPTPAIFLKGAFEDINNSDLALSGLPRRLQNGRDIHRFIGEGAFTLTDNFGLKSLFVNQTTTNRGEASGGTTSGGPPPGAGESNISIIWNLEANWQLSRAFTTRYVYGYQRTDLLNSEKDGTGDILEDFFNLNHYVEFKYQPTEATELLLTYGDEYENPRDVLDNGPASFHKTAKIFRLIASTNF